MLLTILLVCHIIVCLLLIGAVLMQQSEGGALGMGGGPSGFMTARGAGNVLTRATWILFSLFLILSIGLTLLTGRERAAASIVGRGAIEKLDPNALRTPPLVPTTPSDAAPPPVTAPAPDLRLPVAPAPAEPTTQP